jgi:hypothetical protein
MGPEMTASASANRKMAFPVAEHEADFVIAGFGFKKGITSF